MDKHCIPRNHHTGVTILHAEALLNWYIFDIDAHYHIRIDLLHIQATFKPPQISLSRRVKFTISALSAAAMSRSGKLSYKKLIVSHRGKLQWIDHTNGNTTIAVYFIFGRQRKHFRGHNFIHCRPQRLGCIPHTGRRLDRTTRRRLIIRTARPPGYRIDVRTGECGLCEKGWAVAAFIPPQHTAYGCRLWNRPGCAHLTMFCYTAAAGMTEILCSGGPDWTGHSPGGPGYITETIESGVSKLVEAYPQNRLVKHLAENAVSPLLPAARNFYGKMGMRRFYSSGR